MKSTRVLDSPGSIRLISNCESRASFGAAVLRVRARALQPTLARLGMMVFVSLMAACTSMPGKTTPNDKVALQEKVDERMAAADKALKQGQTDQALGHLDGVIRIDPAAKQPWLKRAQIHFDARQYGLAITDAQEVLQRDVRDLTAQSILAVSGLRVSAQALEQLRKVNEVNGSTRSEAESVARIIHEALGEPILVANPTASGGTKAAPSASGGAGASARPKTAVVRPRPAVSPPATQPAAQPTPQQQAVSPVVTPSAGSAQGGIAPKSTTVPPARTNPFGGLQ
jgi:hypothetical protein